MFDDLSFDDDQWLIDNGLADIADPSKLYTKIVERRERGDDGIEAPVSKLSRVREVQEHKHKLEHERELRRGS